MDWGVTSALVTAGGTIIWAIRQEGRINAHDTLFEERKESVEEWRESISRRLDRIDDKLDRLPARISNGNTDYGQHRS